MAEFQTISRPDKRVIKTVTGLGAPSRKELVLPWAKGVDRSLRDLSKNYGSGTAIRARQKLPARPFEIQLKYPDEITIGAGFTQVIGADPASVAAKTFSSISAAGAIYAVYVYGTGWTVASGSILQKSTVAWDNVAFPEATDATQRVFIIASWDYDGTNSAIQDPLQWIDEPLVVDFSLPYGVIAQWSGTTPPAGWVLCDGTNNTPNMKGLFVVGYDSATADYDDPGDYSETTSGGSAGDSGGHATHGGASNDHNDHDLTHYHEILGDFLAFAERDGEPGEDEEVWVPEDLVDLDSDGDADDTKTGAPPGSPRGGTVWDGTVGTNPSASNIADHSETDNRPPYYVLAFIMFQGA